jgi:NADH:ubiquinone oxidoreductase subunit F (NADH-binding)
VGPTDDPGHTGSNPTLVNNVETLAHVALILARGADWYRTVGTRKTPGPLICTVVGDVAHDGFGEVEPGTSLRHVIDELGGGPVERRTIKAVLSGVSNPVLTSEDLDTPVSYESLVAAGGGLGSAGFIVFDDTRSMLSVARMVSRFLYVESCGQCRACKYGTGEITRHLGRLAAATGSDSSDIEIIGQRLRDVTNQNRCFLGEQEQRVISSLLRKFPQDFSPEFQAASLETLPVPKIVDIRDGIATYDASQERKQPDWTYAPA